MAFSVAWTYQIIDRYSGPIRKVQKATDKARASIGKAQKATAKFGSSMASMQSGVATFAGILGGGMMLNTFNNFETAMNKLGAVALANDSQMAKFRDTAKELGATTQFTATQVAEGMVFLKMAGLSVDEVIKGIPGSLQLAAAGGIDLATSADIATNVLKQMGLQITDLARVNDVLATIQSAANTNIIEAAEAMKNVGTTASSLNVSLEETSAFIGSLANAGVKAGQAGTLFRNMLLRLVNPSSKARKIMKKLGVDFKEFVTPAGKIKNLTNFIERLTEKGATTGQIFNILEERGGRAFQALQNIGKPAIVALNDAMKNVTGNAQKMTDIMMRGLPGALKIAASAWESLQIALFESGFADDLVVLLTRLSNFMRKIAKSSPQLLKFAAIAGSLVLALAPVLLMVGFMATGVSALIGLVGGWASIMAFIVAPIAKLTIALKFIGGIIGAILSPAGLMVGLLALIAAATIKAVTSSSKLHGAFAGLMKTLSPVVGLFKSLWEWIGGTEVIAGTLAETFSTVADIVAGVLTFALMSLDALVQTLLIPFQLLSMGMDALFGDKAVNINAQGTQGNINGNITVAAAAGSQVQRADMSTDMPGNLGFNMGGP